MDKITRRELLEIAAATTVAGSTATRTKAVGENLESSGLYTGRPIEIYTGRLSAKPGDIVTLHVSTTAKHYNLQIMRAGLSSAVVWTKKNLHGAFYPTPKNAWEKGCGWPGSVSVKIPHDWRSGFYLISAAPADDPRPQSVAYAFVVVRATNPTAKILIVHPTATYGAYNDYGGASLYVRRKNDVKGGYIGGERSVSYLRPWMPGFLWKPPGFSVDAELADMAKYQDFDGRGISRRSGFGFWGAAAAGFHNWDRVLLEWLEKNGYAYDCATSSDLDLHPEILGRYRLMLSVGHDEYWSWGMRDAVERFVASGGNACFFSADMAWQVRFEDNGNTLVCYKEAVEEDPFFNIPDKRHLTTTLWSSRIVGRPDSTLTGLNPYFGGYARWVSSNASPKGAGGYCIYRPEHWVFRNTGLMFGDCLGTGGKIVHFETDGCPISFERALPYPSSEYDGPASMQILGLYPTSWGAPGSDNKEQMAVLKKLLGENSPLFRASVDNRGHAVMGMFTNNGTVFAAGTTDWTSGLTGLDPAVEQVTRNLLDRLSY